MNEVNLIGRLTRDPELKHTQNNKANVFFTLAVDDGVDGNGQKRANFIPCEVWGKQAQALAQYQAKGRRISVTGKISVSNYQDQQGNNKTSIKVISRNIEYLDSNPNNNNNNNNFNNNNFNNNQNNNFAANNNFNQNNQFNQQQPQQQQFGMQGGGVGMNTGFNQNINNNMNANSQYADFGQDFPSGNEEDFLADVINPFKD